MIPTLVTVGPLPVQSFGLMVALGLILGGMRLAKSFRLYGIEPQLAERYVMAGGVSGLLGARLWFIAENWQHTSKDLLGALFASAGFTFYGGFIIAAITVISMARRDKTDVGRLLDSLGPCLALGYAVGRLGCQLSGDGDYGVPTAGFWGMSYLQGVVPTLPGELVYPTPLFESAASLVVLWVLTRVERSGSYLNLRFQRFGLYLFLISIERVSVEFLRNNPKVFAGLSEAQLIGLMLMLLGGALLGFPRPATSEQ